LSDHPIDNIFFISDSILYILVKQKEARVLYIPNFYRGDFWEEGQRLIEEDDSSSPPKYSSGKAIFGTP
jgi:hypothetical protein